MHQQFLHVAKKPGRKICRTFVQTPLMLHEMLQLRLLHMTPEVRGVLPVAASV
jgi:hypothetical protein